jgi:hypothetical protein
VNRLTRTELTGALSSLQKMAIVAAGAFGSAISMAVLVLLASANQASAAAQTSRIVANGAFAEVSSYAGNTFLYVGVFEGGTARDRRVDISYSIAQCCWTTVAYGTARSRGVTWRGADRLRLNTNVSENANIERFGFAGVVAVVWRKNAFAEFSQSGTSRLKLGDLIFHSHGKTSFSQASVEGSVLGVAIPLGATGSLGTQHQTTITVEHP